MVSTLSQEIKSGASSSAGKKSFDFIVLWVLGKKFNHFQSIVFYLFIIPSFKHISAHFLNP
jgi:hypothetical protein